MLLVFRIFVNLGMKLVGGEYSQKYIDDELDWVDTFYGAHVSTWANHCLGALG